MKTFSDRVGVSRFRMMRNACLTLPVLLAFFPSPSGAVDVVLVSANLRYADLSPHIERVDRNRYDFAIQNTGSEAMHLTLKLSRPDVFHMATFPGLRGPSNLRLIGSDDTEMATLGPQDHQIDWEVPPGAVRRYILQGHIPSKTKFWLWNPDFKNEADRRRFYFHHAVLGALGLLSVLSLGAAYLQKRRRLVIPSVFAIAFMLVMLVRWQVSGNHLGLNNLRIAMVLVSLGLIVAHLTLIRMSDVAERYWRRVVFVADAVLLGAISGWAAHYFWPDYLGAMTVEWLEMFLVMPSAVLCLAVLASFKLPEN